MCAGWAQRTAGRTRADEGRSKALQRRVRPPCAQTPASSRCARRCERDDSYGTGPRRPSAGVRCGRGHTIATKQMSKPTGKQTDEDVRNEQARNEAKADRSDAQTTRCDQMTRTMPAGVPLVSLCSCARGRLQGLPVAEANKPRRSGADVGEAGQSRGRCGRGRPVPVCRCGRGRPVPRAMWAG